MESSVLLLALVGVAAAMLGVLTRTLSRFVIFLVLAFGCAFVGINIQRAAGFPYWSFYPIVVAFGTVLHVTNATLIGVYIRRRAPDFLSNEEIVPGVQMWEITAGTGVVPKWVSHIGTLAIGFFLAVPFELIALAFRAFG